MKKLWIAFIMAVLALSFVAAPAFAWDEQGAYANVDCGEPGATIEDPFVGETVWFFGNVYYDAFAYNHKDYSDGCWYGRRYEVGAYVKVDANGHCAVYDPSGTQVAGYDPSWTTGYIMGDTGNTGWPFYWPDDEDVWGYIWGTWNWAVPVLIEMQGDYTVEQGGDASAEYGAWVQWYKWVPDPWSWCGGDWVPDGDPGFYVEGDPAYDECFASRTFTAHSNAALATGRTRPILTIELTGDDGVFFPSDGWGLPTTDGIVFSDGVWQVEIADGTKIFLDGEWHRKTWIEVDSQGNVTGKYGYDGHIIAEEIGLSSPIKITKVG
jgi:hypothetical protein